jgi:hypothetical protein
MTTFLLFTFLLVCLGIFVRIFWIPLMFIGSILFIILGIIVSAGITAFTFEMIHAICTDGTWTGFSTYFAYSAVFYTVAIFVYASIVGDIFEMAINFFKK